MLLAIVEVSFEHPAYTVSERSGNIEVCVVATFGDNTAPVAVNVVESSNTAQGKIGRFTHGRIILCLLVLQQEMTLL